MIRRMKFPDKTFSNFNHSPKAINSLITQSACVYLDLLPHVKRMLTEIFNDNWTYFLFHYTFFLPEFKLYSCICPPHERVTSWCGLYTWTRFFLSIFWEQISQPLFNDPLSYATFFQNSLQWSLETSLTVCLSQI
jgi:hypothetical protein